LAQGDLTSETIERAIEKKISVTTSENGKVSALDLEGKAADQFILEHCFSELGTTRTLESVRDQLKEIIVFNSHVHIKNENSSQLKSDINSIKGLGEEINELLDKLELEINKCSSDSDGKVEEDATVSTEVFDNVISTAKCLGV
jgi:hypothetical protein